MKGEERHPCRCKCDCDSSAAADFCWLCTQGYHHPSRVVRRELNAKLELSSQIVARLTPDSSSGISKKALAEARRRFDTAWAGRKSA